MSREQLLDCATRFLAWMNAPTVDHSAFTQNTSLDIVVPNPYPGRSQDGAGLLALIEKMHHASSDVQLAPLKTLIDETEHTVVFLLRSSGTHDGGLCW
jgi:hypothetical protein